MILKEKYSGLIGEISDPYGSPGCIDGRKPKGIETVYPKIMGGSILFGVAEYIIDPQKRWKDGPKNGVGDVFDFIFSQLKQAGEEIGVHDGEHKLTPQSSDCGFADKLEIILNTFLDKSDAIWDEVLTNVYSDLSYKKDVWSKVLEKVRIKQERFEELAFGKELVDRAVEKYGASKQELEGHHQEKAVIFNRDPRKSLDTVKANKEGMPAFGFDFGYFVDVLRNKLGWKEPEIEEAKLLVLGLAVATEIVLVEEKGNKRLPILRFD